MAIPNTFANRTFSPDSIVNRAVAERAGAERFRKSRERCGNAPAPWDEETIAAAEWYADEHKPLGPQTLAEYIRDEARRYAGWELLNESGYGAMLARARSDRRALEYTLDQCRALVALG